MMVIVRNLLRALEVAWCLDADDAVFGDPA